jgi:hypothetical protein
MPASVWYNDIQCPVRCQDAHLSAPEKANLEWTLHKACLALNCSVNSDTHTHVHFKKFEPSSQQLGINSDYCGAACQNMDWLARHRRFHGPMLFCSGEVNPEEGYPRPVEFRGQAIATGYPHDWNHAIYMNERMNMLEDSIQHVLRNTKLRLTKFCAKFFILQSTNNKRRYGLRQREMPFSPARAIRPRKMSSCAFG